MPAVLSRVVTPGLAEGYLCRDAVGDGRRFECKGPFGTHVFCIRAFVWKFAVQLYRRASFPYFVRSGGGCF